MTDKIQVDDIERKATKNEQALIDEIMAPFNNPAVDPPAEPTA
jgi:hypothetical protein